MPRLPVLLSCALLALPAFAPGAQAAPAKRTDFDFPSFDGTVLKASTWVPAAGCPCPAIVETNGWNNRHDQASELRFAERYAGQGYYVLGYTSRGWGNSGGEIELDGPNEQNDTRAVIDFLAKQPEVRQDGPGDPRVGMVGESYAGGIQLLAAQQDPRIDSIVPLITWNNLLGSLAPHDVFKVGWVSELYATGQTVGRGAPVPGQHPGDPNASGPSQKLTEWYVEAGATNGPTAEMRTEIGIVRSLRPHALGTPTLLMNGWGDTLFQPNQALATYQDLHARGVPVRLVYFPGGHGIGLAQDDPAFIAADRVRDDWFNVTLRGEAPRLPPYPVLRYRYAEKDSVGETQWPPAGTEPWRGYLGAAGLDSKAPAAAASVELVNPVGPTTCADVPSFQSDTGSLCPHSAPGTSTVLAGPALEADTEVTGVPVAHLQVSSTQVSDVRLFLTLADVDAAGAATPILKQTTPVRLPSGAPTAIDVAMQPVTATIAKGHRISLQVATTDLGFYASREAGAVTLSSGPDALSWLDVPIVPKDAWGDRTPPTVAIAEDGLMAEPRCTDGGGGLGCPQQVSFMLKVTATDNVALAASPLGAWSNPPLQAQGFLLQANGPASVVASLMVPFPTDPTATPMVHFTARDLVGNSRNATWEAPPGWQATGCAQGMASLCPQSTEAKKSVGLEAGVLLLAVLALGLALRRRG